MSSVMSHSLNDQGGADLRHLINAARQRLHAKLGSVDAETLTMSAYNRRYLGEKLASLEGVLQIYGHLLYLSFHDGKAPEDSVLVDYGGGTGLISLLAAELGVGTIIYNDIYDVSCRDVQELQERLDLKLDHIVCGDATELVSYVNGRNIAVDVLTAYDVLEHVYDVASHFATLRRLPSNSLRVIHASGANSRNPFYVRFIAKKQRQVELQGVSVEIGHKERDTVRAFLDVRREMIESHAAELTVEDVEHLAISTRGLIKADIEKCVDEFRATRSITYTIEHPTNTCDPYTGNWAEHLMDFKWLEKIVTEAGFSAEFLKGYYHTGGSLPKKMVKRALNCAIRMLGKRGMFLSPYFVVCATLTEGTLYE
jgi:2-polyprenyl-3-methyl-5-hydroxy-6-metoxy-1,4-benzoquinol methylase